VKGFVACGSTGEAATLNEDEYLQVISAVRKLAKRLPVIAGVNSSSTAKAAAMAKAAVGAGAQGILLTAPPYNKPSQDGIIAHFSAVKSAVSVPLIAYNIPGRTGVAMQPGTLTRMCKEGLAIGVKEASASLDQVMDIYAANGPKFQIVAGDDSLVQAMRACGGVGVISASANVWPEAFAAMCTRSADFNKSLEWQVRALPLVRALFLETNPVPVKAALHLRGLIESPTVREPLLACQSATISKLKEVLASCGLL
jgi:4-hydroxy-tetrahydrodipicolinate synthase